MGILLLYLLLAVLVFLSVSLRKTYQHIPVKELRRRARRGDDFAAVMYRVASYGIGLNVLLWFLIGASGGALFWVLSRNLSGWLAMLLVAGIIWVAFAWLPSRAVSSPNKKVAAMMAPPVAKVLSWMQPLMSWLSVRLNQFRPGHAHTGLYEREDLLELLDRQANQIDNRLSEDELRIARGALLFGERNIREIMTPRRMIKMLIPDAVISPHLMDELHATGFSRFPVMDKNAKGHEEIVGTLFLRDLINYPTSGYVKDIMQRTVYYVNENGSLIHALNAFLKTKHHLFVVVNNFEEIVGVLSIEDVLEQILGRKIIDEFDQYEDLRAVASLQAEQDRKQKPENIVE